MTRHPDPPSVVETKVVHDAHRRATSLLADLTGAGNTAPISSVVELRDLVVGMLRHHHGSEDGDLCSLLLRADNTTAGPLAALPRDTHAPDSYLHRPCPAAPPNPAT